MKKVKKQKHMMRRKKVQEKYFIMTILPSI